MKTIRTIADLKRFKEMGSIPLEYVTAIELEFVDWFRAEGTGESLIIFEMQHHALNDHQMALVYFPVGTLDQR